MNRDEIEDRHVPGAADSAAAPLPSLPPFSNGADPDRCGNDAGLVEPGGSVIDGAFTILNRIGCGGMSVVYRVYVDLDRFDYRLLYAYSQVQGPTHTLRLLRAQEAAGDPALAGMRPHECRRVLREKKLPLPGSIVALKMARESCPSARFEAEWKNLLCLKHPNLIQVYGGGRCGERSYYTMELIENILPTGEITTGFSLRDRIEVIIQAGEGLSFLHSNGIIHRDVKPSNFIVSAAPEGRFVAKITDIGLFRNVEESLDLTGPESVLGTLPYMAPEQMRAPGDADARSDIYSLGASLYELLAGRRPYHDRESAWEVFTAVADGERPIPPRRHDPSLPDGLCDIVQRAMEHDPQRRYQTVREFLSQLRACSEACIPTFAYRTAPHPPKRARILRRAALAAAAAAMLAPAYLFMRAQSSPGEEETVYLEDFESASGFVSKYMPSETDLFRWNSGAGRYEFKTSGQNERPAWVLSEPFHRIENTSFHLEVDFRCSGSPEGRPVEIRLLSLPDVFSSMHSAIGGAANLTIRIACPENNLTVSDRQSTWTIGNMPEETVQRLTISYDRESQAAVISLSDPGTGEESARRRIEGFAPPGFSIIALGSPETESGQSGTAGLSIYSIMIARRQ